MYIIYVITNLKYIIYIYVYWPPTEHLEHVLSFERPQHVHWNAAKLSASDCSVRFVPAVPNKEHVPENMFRLFEIKNMLWVFETKNMNLLFISNIYAYK